MEANEEPNFLFAQPTNCDNFADEDDSESQDIQMIQEVKNHKGNI